MRGTDPWGGNGSRSSIFRSEIDFVVRKNRGRRRARIKRMMEYPKRTSRRFRSPRRRSLGLDSVITRWLDLSLEYIVMDTWNKGNLNFKMVSTTIDVSYMVVTCVSCVCYCWHNSRKIHLRWRELKISVRRSHP